MYDQVIADLRLSYNATMAKQRDKEVKASWKISERQHFLDLLQKEGKQTVLEIGAGTGTDSKFLQDHGLQVIATDLSADMVKLCQQKGLTAYVMDFLGLDFPDCSFDAIYSVNSLLHVPTDSLPTVLQKIQGLLKPTGLFYLGVYGGSELEGLYNDDNHEPKRYFSHHTDNFMRQILSQYFEIVSFKSVPLEDTTHLKNSAHFHFQSITLRRSL